MRLLEITGPMVAAIKRQQEQKPVRGKRPLLLRISCLHLLFSGQFNMMTGAHALNAFKKFYYRCLASPGVSCLGLSYLVIRSFSRLSPKQLSPNPSFYSSPHTPLNLPLFNHFPLVNFLFPSSYSEFQLYETASSIYFYWH